MRDKFVFLPVENTPRELDYKLNLARHFCKAGFKVIIGNPPFIRDELKYKNYRAVFLEKGVNPTPDYYKNLENKGVLLYDLSDEGAFKVFYAINYQPSIESLKCMRKIFLWGEAQKLNLVKLNPDLSLSSKYRVMGSPAFDVCTLKYKSMHQKTKLGALPRNYILIATNFGSYNGYSAEEQFKACSTISPISAEMLVNDYIYEAEQFPVFKEWLEEIIKSFPEETFLIRPHPTEIQENYEKLFKHYPNVCISKEGTPNQAIASSKIVLHKDSSVALHSYLLGVPVVAIGGELSYREQWTLAFGATPPTVKEAKEIIEKLLLEKEWDTETGSQIDSKAKEILTDYFSNIGNSSQEIVNCIAEDAEEMLKDDSEYKLKDTRSSLHKVKHFVRKFLPLYYKVPKAQIETLEKFNKRHVNEKLECLESIDPLGIEFDVKKLYPNTFKISKKLKIL